MNSEVRFAFANKASVPPSQIDCQVTIGGRLTLGHGGFIVESVRECEFYFGVGTQWQAIRR